MNIKKQFIQDEIWTLVIGAAFQRANIYKSSISYQKKKSFKNMLRGYIENIAKQYATKIPVDEQSHISNILSLSNDTKKHKDILNNGQLNFGVSQKLLNLYLKYQWCLGLIEKPPHFPVDRIIQRKLKCKTIISWTKMEVPMGYLSIINQARQQLTTEHPSLAELELFLFERSSAVGKV